MENVKIRDGMFELEKKPVDSPLWNKDLDPSTIDRRNWNKYHIAALWVGMSVCIPTYMLGSSLLSSGLNWWQAILTVLLGNFIVLIPMVLNAHAGTKYGIPFPVFLRSSFGVRGAVLAAMLRGIVACGWFGIQTWIGGSAIYQLLLVFAPGLANSIYLGNFIGLNIAQFFCFLFFWFINIYIVYRGIDSIKWLEAWAAPFLIVIGIVLLVWSCVKVGSISEIFAASNQLGVKHTGSLWKIFIPGLTAMVGFWATLSLNIPDFTRFAKSQKDQITGQLMGLPTTMTFYAFIGIMVTSATLLIFGKAIWDPVALLGTFKNPVIVIVSMFALTVATLSTNIAANVVSPANDISNLCPGKINFKLGGYITGIIGIIMFPWKLIADPHGYIFRWLLSYSSLLGAVGGIMICDYYIIRRTKLNLNDLFQIQGEYTYLNGWNLRAFLAFIIAIIPNIPGFLVAVGLTDSTVFPGWLVDMYAYAWFTSFFLAIVIYLLLTILIPKRGN